MSDWKEYFRLKPKEKKDSDSYLLIGVIVLLIIASFARALYKNKEKDPPIMLNNVGTEYACEIPSDWKTYHFDNAFEIAVPPTVELQADNDAYSRQLKSLGYHSPQGALTFQQKGLSTQSSAAYERYCRIMLLHVVGSKGDYLNKNEVLPLDYQTKLQLQQFVDHNISSNQCQIGSTVFNWVSINGAKAIQMDYVRSGVYFDKTKPVACRIGIFHNNDEMLLVVLSYRKAESEIWKEDFDKVFSSIKWI